MSVAEMNAEFPNLAAASHDCRYGVESGAKFDVEAVSDGRRMMAYPDGAEVRVGDVVALAHGAHTGRVVSVIESAPEVAAWNLAEPGLMIETTFGGEVFHASRSISKDEIALVARAAP